MEEQSFQMVELVRIGRCPWQPRKNFNPEKMAELTRSVKEKGVLEPILVRPIAEPYREQGDSPTAGNLVDHQLVAGERRFRAAVAAAFENGGVDGVRIPAMVRPMSDEEAFDVTVIENPQREDLNELEEAEGFKAYVARHGSGDRAVETLAERVGVSSKYIRRRLRLLALPEKVLEAWGAGEIQYGYLEQLVRLRDEKQILELYKDIYPNGYGDIVTVKDLKRAIDGEAPALKGAWFHTKDAGCSRCPQNSEVQKKQLGVDQDLRGAHCLDRECFKRKQKEYFDATWQQTEHYKKHKTTGFRFSGDLRYGDFLQWHGAKKPAKKCFECAYFLTRLEFDGTCSVGQCCTGDKSCFQAVSVQGQAVSVQGQAVAGKPGKKSEDAPRAAWHGDLFRDEFYKAAIREKLSPGAPPAPIVVNRIILAALCKSNQLCQDLFLKEFREKKGRGYVSDDEVWKVIQQLDSSQVDQALLLCSREVVLDGPFNYGYKDARPLVAAYLKIDLASDYRLTKEYLEKKTIAEIQALAKEHGLWKRDSAQAFLEKELKKKPGQFHTCKKDELIRIILESGMDLAGVVPKEILGKE